MTTYRISCAKCKRRVKSLENHTWGRKLLKGLINCLVIFFPYTPYYPDNSGVARISQLIGHSMGTLRLYELPREVQRLIGRSGGILPPENLGILHPPKSILRPYEGLRIIVDYISHQTLGLLTSVSTCTIIGPKGY